MRKTISILWQVWKRFAHRVARIQTAILVTIFYFLVLTPIGLVAHLFGWDPLCRRAFSSDAVTNWKPVSQPEPDSESLRHQS